MRQVSDPRFWAGVHSITGISLYALSYFALDLPVSFTESFGMFWGIASLVLASLAIYQASDIREKYHADTTIREHLIAIYGLAASAFISMGLSIELPWEHVPLAIAAQIAVTAWVYQRTRIDFLKNIQLATLSITGNAPHLSQVTRYFVDAPLVKLGIPAMLMAMALWVFAQHGEIDKKFFNYIPRIGSRILSIQIQRSWRLCDGSINRSRIYRARCCHSYAWLAWFWPVRGIQEMEYRTSKAVGSGTIDDCRAALYLF